jgi:arylsulfatase A-like enzyme
MSPVPRRDLFKAAAVLSTAALAPATLAAPDEAHATRSGPASQPLNVIFIVLDDVGYADLGCFGSEIPTPAMDALAAGGLRYTNFRTTAMCSPTRAALLTGLNHHSADVGWLADVDSGRPGYRGTLSRNAATLAETLRANGWSTFLVGKWHLSNAEHEGSMSPTASWPGQRGFERCYWFHGHSSDYFKPANLYEGSEPADVADPDDYYTLDDFTDRAMAYIRTQKAQAPDKPFFLHLAYNGAHSPLQSRAEDRDAFGGRYEQGWDRVREARLAKQKALGVVPASTVLPPRNPDVAPWDDLPPKERRLYARYMEVYAGIVRRLDHNIGRLMRLLEEMRLSDDTLVVLLSDNGGSPEGGPQGTPNILATALGGSVPVDDALTMYEEMGGPDTLPHYPLGWAMASNTPFRHYKQQTFLGGVADPLIVRCPKRIPAEGGLRHQFVHVIDIYPTVLELLGLEAPSAIEGRPIKPVEGASFAPTFRNPGASPPRRSQYFELGGQRAMHLDGWRLVDLHERGSDYKAAKWRLYGPADINELEDVSALFPEKVQQLEAEWAKAAARYNVLPMDDRSLVAKLFSARMRAPPRPRWEILPPIEPIAAAVSPALAGRDHTIRIDIAHRRASDDGVLLAMGSIHWGFVLYIQDGRLAYESSLRPYGWRMASKARVPAGESRVQYVQTMTERPFNGRGALYIDDVKVAETGPSRMLFGVGYDGLSIGRDAGAPVSRRYRAPFAFRGEISRVVIDIDPRPPTPDEMRRVIQLLRNSG